MYNSLWYSLLESTSCDKFDERMCNTLLADVSCIESNLDNCIEMECPTSASNLKCYLSTISVCFAGSVPVYIA